jgi:hypothetical protein
LESRLGETAMKQHIRLNSRTRAVLAVALDAIEWAVRKIREVLGI